MKKQKSKIAKKQLKKLKDFNFNFENEIEIEIEKTKEKLVNKNENEIEIEIEKTKMNKKEKKLLKDLLVKFKNSELKEKWILIKKIEFSEKDIKKLNDLLLKFLNSKKKIKSFENLKDSKLFNFSNDIKQNKKFSENLFFMNWKTNIKYLNSIQNENRKILYSEYVKIQNIWKSEKDIIKWIEYEKMKMQKTLQFIENFNSELKKKNAKDIKKLNAYFIKSNIAKNIKNSKLVKIENENEYNIFGWIGWNFEKNYIEKVNNKFIVDLLKNENELKVEKIVKYLNEIQKINSEYLCKTKSKKDYINKNKSEIVKKANRIIKNYMKKYWIIENENKLKQVKKDILKLYEKQLNIVKILVNQNENEYNKYNWLYKNLQNKIKYNAKDIKNKYEYLLSE